MSTNIETQYCFYFSSILQLWKTTDLQNIWNSKKSPRLRSDIKSPLFCPGSPQNSFIICSSTFKKGDLPPVKAFWSLTMYDGKTQLLINNPLDRYLLNSPMMDDFVMNNNGSLTIYIQKESPGAALKANWLPAPDGPFYGVLRLYGPEEAALKGDWTTPAMVKVQ